MRFKYVRPDRRLTSNFTSFVGSLDVTYADLVSLLGKPNNAFHDPYKVDAEWIVRTPAGVATIYNYKTGRNYLGKQGLPVKDILTWNVGGHDTKVFEWIVKELESNSVPFSIVSQY